MGAVSVSVSVTASLSAKGRGAGGMSGKAVPTDGKPGSVHRWFAVELNNATWDLIDGGLSERSAASERERALYGAYASTYHWLQVGNVANHGRGEHLIGTVACVIGQLEAAGEHAARCTELVAGQPDAFADWDLAFLAELRARIAARAGADDAAQLRVAAERAAAEVADAADRRICVERLAAEPWGVVGE